MDQIKIGKFIAEMRKEQSLTQIDLAEKLGISNKTISKWECGNGMPDYAVMENLCEALHINVNELLSGERLPSKEYNKKAEENMMSLIQESNENYKKERKEFIGMVLGIIAIILLFFYIVVSFGGLVAIGNFLDVVLMTFLLAAVILVLLVAGMLRDFGKAFLLITQRAKEENIQQIRKSMVAVKTVIVTVNIAGVLAALVGIIESLRVWAQSDYEVQLVVLWISVALLSCCYALVISLILTPIYMRLKNKLIVE